MKLINLIILSVTIISCSEIQSNNELLASDNIYCKGCQKWVETFATDTNTKHWEWVLPNSSWQLLSNEDSSAVNVLVGTTGGVLKVKSLNSMWCVGAIRQQNVSVINTVTPTIHISVNANHLFSQTHTNGGGSPQYAWVKDGITTDSTHSSWTDPAWSTGSNVMCFMLSSAKCATPDIVVSNLIIE